MGQATVNNEVQEAVANTHYIIQGAIDAWNLLPVFIQILLCSLIVTSLLMQFVKKVVLFKYSKAKRIRRLWLWGMVIGISVTGAGFKLFDGGLIHQGLWATIGVSVSTAAMGVHFISMKWIFPVLTFIANEAMDRAYLMATKKPRPKVNK